MAMTTDSAAQCERNDHPADRAFVSDSNRDTRLGFATGRYIPARLAHCAALTGLS